MIYTYPDYYKNFKCIADKCEATCCAGWQIMIDDEAMDKYDKYNGDFKKRLNKGINKKESCFKQRINGRCIFLNKENLCDMQLSMGEEGLCKICSEYPRHIEEFENVRETTLSVSCPVVAADLLSNKNKVAFYDIETDEEETFEDFDLLFYSMLTEARQKIIEVLQNRKLSVYLRMYIVLAIAHDLQGRINRAQYFEFEDVLNKYLNKKVQLKVAENLIEYEKDEFAKFCYNREIFRDMYKLEHLIPGFGMQIRRTEKSLYGRGVKYYNNIDKAFRKWQKNACKDYEIKLEQLLVYFIFTYMCGAVYDGDLYGKVYMSVMSVFIINEMIKAKWAEQKMNLSEHDIIKIVYTYSRELEHSDINLDRFEKFAKIFK